MALLRTVLRFATHRSVVTIGFKFGAAFFAFVMTLIIARRFGPEGSGVMGIALTLMSICGILGGFGIDISSLGALSKYRAMEKPRLFETWFISASLVSCAGTLGISLVALAIVVFGGVDAGVGKDNSLVIVATVGCALFVVASRLFSVALRASGAVNAANLSDPFGIPALFVLLLVVFPWVSLPVVAALYAVSAIVVATVAGWLFWLVARRDGLLTRRFRPRPRAVLRRSLPLFGSQIAGFVSQWMPILALAYLATTADVGLFRVAFQLVLLVAFVQQAVEVSTVPVMAKYVAEHDLQGLSRYGQQQIALTLGGALVPALLLVAIPAEILSIFGPAFEPASTAVRVMVAAQIFALCCGPIGSAMLSLGKQKTMMVNAIVGATVLCILLVILVPAFGVHGAAWAVAASVVARALLGTIALLRDDGIFLPLRRWPMGRSHDPS